MTTRPATLHVSAFLGVRETDLPRNAARTFRAATEPMFVIPVLDADDVATGLYHLVSGSTTTYTVDLVDGMHSCPDVEYNGDSYIGGCKHQRRVVMGVNRGDLPAPDEPLRDHHLDALNRALATAAVVAKRDNDTDLWYAVRAATKDAEREFGADAVRTA